MSAEALKTLFHPFASGELPGPTKSERVLFLGAEPGFLLPEDFRAKLSLVQGFRPYFRALEAQGHEVAPRAKDENYDLALVLLGRHRGENEARLAEAVDRVNPGGLIVAAGSKTEGADSCRKRLEKLLPPQGHLSKFHGTVFWLERPSGGLSAEFGPAGQSLVERRFLTAPGMFSHGRIDPASRLLAENLPDDITGAAADFCAGWGFLAATLAERAPSLSGLDLYEADFESLEAAKQNLEPIAPSLDKKFFWLDLVAETVERRYDFVVMNPPFHQGRAADPAIGQGMVRAAAAALKPGGRLMMVANRGLPYETALAASFKTSGETCRDERYKVLWGRR
jgi:16S rRNA (guanine1207-N2)-methyltransferase